MKRSGFNLVYSILHTTRKAKDVSH